MHLSVTLILIVVNVVVSMMAFNNGRLLERLLFWPPAIRRGQVDRFITHGFVHADGQHLLFNMITLYFFGRAVEPFFERYIGPLGFMVFYLLGLVVAILPAWIQHRNDSFYRSLGASGAVSAVLFAFILLSPWSTIYVFVVPVPAILYAVAYVAWSVYANRRGGDNINHSAHLWGAAYGVIFSLVMEPRLLPFFFHQLVSPSLGLR